MSLVTADAPAEFLKEWISLHHSKSSYETLAKKCGMRSKSSLHDIVSGRRKASLESLEAICKGLKISGVEKKLLTSLWKEKNIPEIAQMRHLVILKDSKQKSKAIPTLEGWDYAYSALGSLEKGASIKQVSNMIKMSEEQSKKILTHLLHLEVVSYDAKTSKYKARALHTLFEENSFNEKKYLMGKAAKLKQSVNAGYGESQQNLFRNFVFSIPAQSYPKLREKLKMMLDEFADETESQSGSELLEIFIAMERK